MSEVVGEAVIKVRTDESDVDFDKSGRAAGGSFSKGFGVPLKGLAGIIGGAIAVEKVLSFTKGAIDGASDLNETVSKTNVIFKDGADSVLGFAETAASSLGQTKQQALDAASTFGTFGKAAGLSGQDLAKFSTDFVSLSSDLASFNNTSPEQAIDAIGAALRGEAEPLRAYGVLLDDASMRQEALKQGLISSTEEALTPQQKVLAAQALIMKQTSDAQGDFERTSDGLANKQRILSATFTDLQTKIGSALLPVVLDITSALLDLVNWLPSLGPVFSAVGDAITGAFSGGGGKEAVTGFFDVLRSAASEVLPVIQDLIVGQLLPAFLSLATYLQTSLMPVVEQAFGIFTESVIPTVVALATLIYGTLWPALISIYTTILTQLKPVFDQLVATFQESVLPTVQRVVDQIRNELIPALQPLIERLLQVIGFITKLAATILSVVLPPLIRLAGFLISNIVPAVVSVITFLVRLIGGIVDAGVAVGKFIAKIAEWYAAWVRLVRDGISAVLDAITSLPGKIIDLGGRFLSAGRSIMEKFLDGLKGVGGFASGIADAVWQAVRGVINSAIDRLNSLLEFTINVGPKSFTVNPPNIGHLQGGTRNWIGGPAIVGEVGPERVWLPPGTRVDTTAQSRQQEAGDFDSLVTALAAVLGPMLAGIRPITVVAAPGDDPEVVAMKVANRLAAGVG